MWGYRSQRCQVQLDGHHEATPRGLVGALLIRGNRSELGTKRRRCSLRRERWKVLWERLKCHDDDPLCFPRGSRMLVGPFVRHDPAPLMLHVIFCYRAMSASWFFGLRNIAVP